MGAWDFDFVIGSSHLVGGVDPYYPEYFEKYGDHNGILRYFESILANIRTFDGFDVYGHLDYIVRYCRAKAYCPAEYSDITDEILKTLISMGKGIELNTAGLKYGLGWAHPHPEVLKRYRELGGEMITVGSDGIKRSITPGSSIRRRISSGTQDLSITRCSAEGSRNLSEFEFIQLAFTFKPVS